jgi:glucosamine 6-phosphate synthetase-like amidotransferase/phosphosugar isomerase protein
VPSRAPEDDLAAERAADLIEAHWIPPLHLAVSRALAGLTGAFQWITMSTNEPGRVICASRGFALCLGMTEDGVVVCSDPSDVLEDMEGVVSLRSGEIGVVDADGWDLLAPDAMARVRRPLVDLTSYRAWARHEARAMDPSRPHTLEPDQTALSGARQVAQGGR